MKPLNFFWFFILSATPFFPPTIAGPFLFPTANLSTKWTNNLSLNNSITYMDGAMIRPFLLQGSFGPSFACGFFCTGKCDAFLFSIFIIYGYSGTIATFPSPQVVWSANRDRPVKENATLEFSGDGNLVLRDFDRTIVWSTNTSGKAVVIMNLTETGNLELVDKKNDSVWSSADYPTDSWVLGQTLRQGQRMTANVSATNWTEGQLYLSIVDGGFATYVDSNPPQLYHETGITGPKAQNKSTYITFTNGSLDIFALFTDSSSPDMRVSLTPASSLQYMRLESDGHLRLYEVSSEGWKQLGDVFHPFSDDCAYPTVCGEYGICSNMRCSCPMEDARTSSTYFQQVDATQPNLGCYPVTPLSCESNRSHQLIALNEISYFNYIDFDAPKIFHTNAESCKLACLKNCSCKAALFQYGGNASDGNCHLPSQLFSMKSNNPNVSHFNSSAYVKVQIPPTVPTPSRPTGSDGSENKKVSGGFIVGIILGALLVAFLVIVFIIVLVRRRKERALCCPCAARCLKLTGLFFIEIIKLTGLVLLLVSKKLTRRRKEREFEEDDQFDIVQGIPSRFSFEELKIATENFCRKLGKGGFGSVFEGTLRDGMRIAVKRLDSVGQGKKEFLAEVKTIGSIHHINLVRLIGFCAEKSYKLLVYEYMCNGSLDKWIFNKGQDEALDWQTRRRIITDIAKGLSYLHEECRQTIAHLDIKPQNILLDQDFKAKVSDFGLSKLIDQDHSQVMTRMRGTPGYLAPEWLTSRITEKADVYSFGVVIMEIVCGRKNLDYSQPEECFHLLGLLQDKVEANQLSDIIDSRSDMQLHVNEIVKIMELAMWCLQSSINKRPSMSTVVRVLEGSMNVESNIDYNFSAPAPFVSRNANNNASPAISDWHMSEPR